MQHSRSSIIKRATSLLEQHGVVVEPVDVEVVARRMGIIVRKTPTNEDLSGFLVKQNGVAVIGVNALHHVNRQRFTIAHEIGHFLLHDFDELHVDKSIVRLRDGKSSKGEIDAEIEANCFAAELLMPQKFIEKALTFTPVNDLLDDAGMLKLAKRFQVSVQAMSNRLRTLGYIASAEL